MLGCVLGFVMWLAVSFVFVGLGIRAYISKNAVPFGFWANVEMFPVEDVKAYNRAMGKLWMVYGIVFAILGIPLLGGQNTPGIIFSILGIMLESIAAMIIYMLVIKEKYERK